MSDPRFSDFYNEALLSELEKQFGRFIQHHASLSVSSEIMLRMVSKMQDKPRFGEVVMVVPTLEFDRSQHIWLHTKAFYPEGVYRLMTGGLEPKERPEQALIREVEEETGFKTKIDRCLAVITYTLLTETGSLPFVSYLFLTAPTVGFPDPLDPAEAITEFKAVSVESLPATVQKLGSLSGDFADWGEFRAIAHQVAWEQLTTVSAG